MAVNDTSGFLRVAKRSQRAFADAGIERDVLDCTLDLEAADMACGLDLAKLEAFERFDFAHDVFGIAKNLNRMTGELENSFLPRSARH